MCASVRFMLLLVICTSDVYVSEITMITGWLLLLLVLVVVSSQSVDSQSTTDDETCSDGGPLSEIRKDMKRLSLQLQELKDNQQRLFQQHRGIKDNQTQILRLLQLQQGYTLYVICYV